MADARPAPHTTEEAAPPEAKPSTNGHAVDAEARPLAEGIDTPTPLPLPTATEVHERFEAIFGGIQAPFAFLDLDAVWANAADMLRRSRGKPIRIASKSIRSRPVLERLLDLDPGFQGALTSPCRRRTGFGSPVSETWSSPIRPPIGRPSPGSRRSPRRTPRRRRW
jgi:hypothetical protein